MIMLLLLSVAGIISLSVSIVLCIAKARRTTGDIRTDENLAYSVHSSPGHDTELQEPMGGEIGGIEEYDYDYVFTECGIVSSGTHSTLPVRSTSKKRPVLPIDRIAAGGSVRAAMQTDERKVDFEEIYQCLKQIKAEKELRGKTSNAHLSPNEANICPVQGVSTNHFSPSDDSGLYI